MDTHRQHLSARNAVTILLLLEYVLELVTNISTFVYFSNKTVNWQFRSINCPVIWTNCINLLHCVVQETL